MKGQTALPIVIIAVLVVSLSSFLYFNNNSNGLAQITGKDVQGSDVSISAFPDCPGSTTTGELIISGATTFAPINQKITCVNITVTNTGILTINNHGVSDKVINISVENFVVQDGGVVNSSTRGFLGSAGGGVSGNGPGASAWQGGSSAGAGYGGIGGGSVSSAVGGISYGRPSNPDQSGSGAAGGATSGSTGGNGGGAFIINATNSIEVNGSLLADGGDGINSGSYTGGSGSGGSVWLIANSFTGNGIIRADGGDGIQSEGGAGAGGRISVWYSSASFNGNITATKGSGGAFDSSYMGADHGTVYFKRGNTVDGYFIGGFKGSIIEDAFTLKYPTQSGANITLGNFTMLPGSILNTNFTGFKGSAGGGVSGNGPGASAWQGGSSAGAGYGGIGGKSVGSAAGGTSYGSSSSPNTIGSGAAGGATSGSGGGSGGGMILINASNTINISGTIIADGGDGINSGSYTGGSGSGGSVWLIANSFTGNGIIRADGGDGIQSEGGAGAGGRISVWYSSASFNGNITATKGSGGAFDSSYMGADHGTVYFKRGNTVDGYFIGGFKGSIIEDAFTLKYPTQSGANITLGNFTMLPGSILNTNFTGFKGSAGGGVSGNGPGASAWQGGSSAGAGYGGIGGKSVGSAAGGTSYGSSSSPNTIGSGAAGGATSGSGGGSGGGMILINASNTINISGTIIADGGDGINSGSYTGGSGSGGSVWLIANSFTGNGIIRADGGDGIQSEGGAGAGGRISVWYSSASFNGNITATKGSGGAFDSSYMGADHGTVYFKRGNTVDGYFIGGFKGSIIEDAFTLKYPTQSGANITLGNFTMLPGSILNTNFTGFKGSAGGGVSGNGPGASAWQGGSSAGAGYGGIGGKSVGSAAGGTSYGSSSSPNTIGSGAAGGATSGSGGGSGGGMILINASNTINISGTIIADGGDGINSGSYTGGSGSGGSVWLIANSFTGNGIIRADGGDGIQSEGGAGAGGRISVWYCGNVSNNASITLRADNGSIWRGSPSTAGKGTIYQNITSCNVNIIDADGDGFSPPLDCNDNNANIIPPSSGYSLTRNVTLCPGTYNLIRGMNITATNVTVACNNTVLNGTNDVDDSSFNVLNKNATIFGCSITNFAHGVTIWKKSNNSIINNVINMTGTLGQGIVTAFDSNNNNLIQNNTVNILTPGNSITGIQITGQNNRVIKNIVKQASSGIVIGTGTLTPDQNNILVNNTIIGSDANGIWINNANVNNTLTTNNISSSAKGINIVGSNSNTFTDNLFNNNTLDIYTDITQSLKTNNLILTMGQNQLTFPNEIINVTNMSNVYLNSSIVGVDSVVENDMNISANVTLFTSSCTPPIFFHDEFTRDASQTVNEGQLCDGLSDPACTGISCSGGLLSFNVKRFSSYAIGCQDVDGDGFNSTSSCGIVDCDDNNSAIRPPIDGEQVNESVLFCPGKYDLFGIAISASNINVACNATVLNGGGQSGSGVAINGVNNVTFSGCTVIRYDQGILVNTTTNSIVKSNVMENMTLEGLRLDNSSNNNISNNLFKKTGDEGLVLTAGSINNLVSNNTMFRLTAIFGYAVDINTNSDNNTIIGNNITNSGGICIGSCFSGTAANFNKITSNILRNISSELFYSEGGSSNITITNNFFEQGAFGVFLGFNTGFETSDSVFVNNTINNDTNTGGTLTDGIFIKGRNNLIENNTIVNNTRGAGVQLGGTSKAAVGNIVKNNILVANKYGIKITTSSNNTIIGPGISIANTSDIFTTDNNNNTLILVSGQNSVSFYDSFINVSNVSNIVIGNSIVSVNSSAERRMNTTANVLFTVASCSLTLFKAPGFHTSIGAIDSSTAFQCDSCSVPVCTNNIMNFTTTSFSTIFVASSPNITKIFPNATNETQQIDTQDTNLTINTTAVTNVTFNVTAIDDDSNVLTFTWFVDGISAFVEAVNKVLGAFVSVFSHVFNTTGLHNVSVTVNDTLSNDTFTYHVNVMCGDSDGDGFNETSECGIADCNDNDYSIRPPKNNERINSSVTFCPGRYNISNGITLNASNVAINCNNTILDGQALTFNVSINNGLLSKAFNNVSILGCTIANYNNTAIYTDGNDTVITNNSLINDCCNVITLNSNSHGGIVSYNSVINISDNPLSGAILATNGAAIFNNYIEAQTNTGGSAIQAEGNNNTIYNNNISRFGAFVTSFGILVDFSYVGGQLGNNVVFNNSITNVKGYGISSNGPNNTILQNTITNSTVDGIAINQFLDTSPLDVYNNTVQNNLVIGSGRYGISLLSQAHNNLLFDNTIINSTTADIFTDTSDPLHNNTLVLVARQNQLRFTNAFLNVTNLINIVIDDSITSVNSTVERSMNTTANVSFLVSSCELALFKSPGYFTDIESAKPTATLCDSCSVPVCADNMMNFSTTSFSTIFVNSTPTIIIIYPNGTNQTQAISRNESNVSINVFSGSNITFNATAIGVNSPFLSFNWTFDGVEVVTNVISSINSFFNNLFSFLFFNLGLHNISVTVNDSIGGSDTFTFYANVSCHDGDGDGANGTSVCGVVDCNDNDASIRPPLSFALVNSSVTFCPGTYNMQNGVIVNASSIIVVCNSTIFNGTGGTSVLGPDDGINVTEGNNITITGCEIRNYDNAIDIRGSSSNVNISNNLLDSNIMGVLLDAVLSDNNLIENNTIVGTNSIGSSYGIRIGASIASTSNNIIANNYISNAFNHSVMLGCSPLGCPNNTITDNIFVNSSLSDIFLDDSSYTGVFNNLLQGLGIGQYGINLSLSSNVVMINNIIVNHTQAGIVLVDVMNSNVSGNTISDAVSSALYFFSGSVNNTIANNSISDATTAGIRFGATSVNNTVLDNSYSNNGADILSEPGEVNNTLVITSSNFDIFSVTQKENKVMFISKFINVTDINNIFINDSIIAVNTTAEPSLNTTANVSFVVQSCNVELFKSDGFHTKISEALPGSRVCEDCINKNCGGTNYNFTVSSFSTVFAAYPPNITTIFPNATLDTQTIDENDTNTTITVEAGTNQSFSVTVRDEDSNVLTFNWFVDGILSFVDVVTKAFDVFQSFFYALFNDISLHNITVSVNDSGANDSFTFHVQSNDSIAPVWNETPSDIVIELGTSFFMQVNATDIVAVDEYSISDNENFTIGSISGIIINNTFLRLGTYALNISVNDTSNNIRYQMINVIVNDSKKPGVSKIIPTSANQNVLREYNASVFDLDLLECRLYVNNVLDGSMSILGNGSLMNITNRTKSIATPGTYQFLANCSDSSGNYNDTSITSVTILSTASPGQTGGGGGTVRPPEIHFAPCSGNFTDCTGWSTCTNGLQTRTCNDLMRCYKPRIESQSCPITQPTGQVVEKPTTPEEKAPAVKGFLDTLKENLTSGLLATTVLLLVVISFVVVERIRAPAFKFRKDYEVTVTRNIINKAKQAMAKDEHMATHLYNDAVRAYWYLDPEKKKIFEKELKDLKHKLSK